jgi:hypothetical protein
MRIHSRGFFIGACILAVFFVNGTLIVNGQSGGRSLDRKPPTQPEKVNEGVLTVCHLTSSETNPYETLTIPESALPAHQAHGDIYPVPANGCPTANGGGTPTPTPGATPEPITVLLLGAGLAGVGYASRRLRRGSQEQS